MEQQRTPTERKMKGCFDIGMQRQHRAKERSEEKEGKNSSIPINICWKTLLTHKHTRTCQRLYHTNASVATEVKALDRWRELYPPTPTLRTSNTPIHAISYGSKATLCLSLYYTICSANKVSYLHIRSNAAKKKPFCRI